MRKVGIVLVHGIGNQQRYDFLKEFTSEFFGELRRVRGSEGTTLAIDRVELVRMPARTLETSDLFSFFGKSAAPAAAEERGQSLFRPVQIASQGQRFSIYESYWADEDLRYTLLDKLKLNLWLATTVLNPIFNAATMAYRGIGVVGVRLVSAWFTAALVDFLLHIAESALALVGFVFKKTAFLKKFGETIFEYAGDIKLYYSQKIYFHNQTKSEVLQARFDEVLIKACLENDEVHLVGHSLGAVIAFDGLHRHRVAPTKMSLDFLDHLRHKYLTKGPVRVSPQAKVRSLVTLGCPLDKTYLFFPSARPVELQGEIELSIVGSASDESTVRAEVGPSPAAVSWKWHNVNDVSDPIGDRLVFYGESSLQGGFPTPKNHRVARAWLPSTAHNGLLRNRAVREWLTSHLADDEKTCELADANAEALVIHGAWMAALATVSAIVVSFGFCWVLDLGLGTLDDLYQDAESHTIFQKLELGDAIVHQLREALDVNRGPFWRWLLHPVEVAVRTYGIFLAIVFPFAAARYGVVERLRAQRKRAA